MICSQVVTLRTDLSATRADYKTTRSSANSATLELNSTRTNNEWLESPVAELSFTVEEMRLQPATAQSSISPAALELFRDEHYQYLGLLRSSIDHFNRPNNDFTNFLGAARDRRLTVWQGVGSLLDKFCAALDNDDVPEDVPVPPLTEQFFVAFNKLHFCCSTVRCLLSLFSFIGLCPSISTLQLTLCQSKKAHRLLFLIVSHLRHSLFNRGLLDSQVLLVRIGPHYLQLWSTTP